MQHQPHPVRYSYLGPIRAFRAEALRDSVQAALQSRPGYKSPKEVDVIQYWAARKESANAGARELDFYRSRDEFLSEASAAVLRREIPSVFDVSALIDKLPDQDVDGFNLADLVLPGGGTAYLDFGHQPSLAIDGDLSFEGAYVRMDETNDEQSVFHISLVIDDPDFEEASATRPYGETLKRMTSAVRLRIDPDASVLSGFKASLIHNNVVNVDAEILEQTASICRAFQLAVRSMLYLGSGRDIDIEFGFNEDAPSHLVKAALKGDFDAVATLRDEGFPLIQHVGRNIAPIASLEQPSFEIEQELTFGM